MKAGNPNVNNKETNILAKKGGIRIFHKKVLFDLPLLALIV